MNFEDGSAVWVYQFFRAKSGEKTTRKLAFTWHGPYRVVSKVNDNAFRIAIPSHPDRIVTINVNRLKPYRGRWSRPLRDEVPQLDAETSPEEEPLQEDDLPETSFAERRIIGGEEVVVTGVSEPIVEIVGRRKYKRELQYLALLADYSTLWLPRSELDPASHLVNAFDDRRLRDEGAPEMRRNARLAEANAEVDDYELLF